MTDLDKKSAGEALQPLLQLPMELEEAVHVIGCHEQAHNPKFTGEKIFRGDPEQYERIVKLRVMLGASIREIAKVERVSPQTVMAVMRREQQGLTVEAYRDETAAELAVAVQATLGRIMEDLADDEKMKGTGLREKAYLLKEILEKRELLSGGATHRGEVADAAEQVKEAAQRHARQARELLDDGLIVDAEIVEEG